MTAAKESTGRLVARRSLASIIKITSKKRHPDLITFKYGAAAEADDGTDAGADAGASGDLIVTDMDRY